MNKHDENTVDSEEQDLTSDETVQEDEQSLDEEIEQSTEEELEEADASLEAKLQAELVDAQDQVLRARADFDNFRKRKAREMEQVRKMAAEALIQDFLPAIDNLNLTLDHVEDMDSNLATGVTLVLKQMMDVLATRGLTPIEALGQPFDPNLHEAMSQAPSEEFEKDHVAQEFQKGYMLRDSVLRPSKVVVSTGAPEQDESDDSAEETATAE